MTYTEADTGHFAPTTLLEKSHIFLLFVGLLTSPIDYKEEEFMRGNLCTCTFMYVRIYIFILNMYNFI
jgi:hypothetical protein